MSRGEERQPATSTPHELINPESLPVPTGFSHAVVARPGRQVFVAGQIATGADGSVVTGSIDSQFELAAANVVSALEAAGAEPEHLVSLLIFVTDVPEYRDASREIGAAYRRHFGRHFPAMALFGIGALFDPEAKVELVATAVVPESA
ncbi:MAG: RidA family protein [Solirubrobacterales bacterium]